MAAIGSSSSWLQAGYKSWVREGGLHRLVAHVLRPTKFSEQPHIKEIADWTDGVFAAYGGDRSTYAMLLAPRETGKTETSVIGGVIAFLDAHPDAAVLIDGYVHDLAKERLEGIKWHIEANEKFRRNLGDWKTGAREWNQDSVRLGTRAMGDKEPSIDTAGIDKSKVGGHYDLIVADDLVNEKNSDTPGQREAVKRHIKTLYPLLKKGGVLLIVGTRWHYDDAYGDIIKRDEKEVERARELGQDASVSYKKYIKGAILADGSLYAPDILSYDRLAQLKRDMGPLLFAPNYLNVPMEDDAKIFPAAELQWYEGHYYDDRVDGPNIEFKNGDRTPVRAHLFWDPMGAEVTPDSLWHGISVVLVNPEQRWYIHEAEQLRGKPSEVIARMVYLIREYRPDLMSGEFVGAHGLWKEMLIQALRKARVSVPGMRIIKSVPTRSKDARIATALQPRYCSGMLQLRVGLADCAQQFDEFPKSAAKDIIDSIAQGHEVAVGPTPRELERRAPIDPDEDDPGVAANVSLIQRAGAWTGTSTPVPISGGSGWQRNPAGVRSTRR